MARGINELASLRSVESDLNLSLIITSAGGYARPSNNPLYLGVNGGSPSLAIDATGNVNIGGVTSSSSGVHIGGNPGAYIEMAGVNPLIDFKTDSLSDFDARIMLAAGKELMIYATSIGIGGDQTRSRPEDDWQLVTTWHYSPSMWATAL